MPDLLNSFDFAIVRWLNGFVGASDSFDYIAWNIVNVHLIKGGVLAGLLWGVWSHHRPDRDIALDLIRSFSGILAAVLVGRLLQLLLPFRARPLHEPSLEFRPTEYTPPTALEGWSAFPSDHGVLFGAVAMAVFYRSHIAGVFALAWALIVIFLPRVYTGLHYPSDVLVGCALGGGLMCAAMAMPVPKLAVSTIGVWRSRYVVPFQALTFMLLFEISTLFPVTRRAAHTLAHILGLDM